MENFTIDQLKSLLPIVKEQNIKSYQNKQERIEVIKTKITELLNPYFKNIETKCKVSISENRIRVIFYYENSTREIEIYLNRNWSNNYMPTDFQTSFSSLKISEKDSEVEKLFTIDYLNVLNKLFPVFIYENETSTEIKLYMTDIYKIGNEDRKEISVSQITNQIKKLQDNQLKEEAKKIFYSGEFIRIDLSAMKIYQPIKFSKQNNKSVKVEFENGENVNLNEEKINWIINLIINDNKLKFINETMLKPNTVINIENDRLNDDNYKRITGSIKVLGVKGTKDWRTREFIYVVCDKRFRKIEKSSFINYLNYNNIFEIKEMIN
jgi:hypothetical protein